ncbi:MAG: HAD family hydrolase [Kiritimatiellia bacterium]
MKRCVFFDRDGIVNVSPGPGRYVERWEDFHLQAGFPDVLGRVTRLGFVSVIVTNQRCVALGRITVDALERMHERLRVLLMAAHGLEVADVLYCPHDRGSCECRKPKPGLLLEAARRHALDLAASWMVGDSATDVEAGRAAGCRTIRVRAGGGGEADATVSVASLDELDSLIANGRLVL